jgi:hypothetical protein
MLIATGNARVPSCRTHFLVRVYACICIMTWGCAVLGASFGTGSRQPLGDGRSGLGLTAELPNQDLSAQNL